MSAIALCAALAAQAAPTALAPACTASVTNPTWADCAGAFSRPGRFDSSAGETVGGLTFAAAIDEQFDFDGDGAPISSVDFASPGASHNLHRAGKVQSHASIDATQPLPAIPEPHTNLLMLAGLAAIGFMATRRRRP